MNNGRKIQVFQIFNATNTVYGGWLGCMRQTMNRKIIFLVVLAFPVLCMGGGFESSRLIDSKGGVIDVPKMASVEFEPNSFLQKREAKIKYSCDYKKDGYTTDIMGIYQEHKIMSNGGPAHSCFFVIRTAEKPSKPLRIKIRVSQEFLTTLGGKFHPVLFVAVVQHGADNEQIDDVIPLDSNFDIGSKEITAALPEYAFTNDFAWKWEHDVYEAFIIIGSALTGT